MSINPCDPAETVRVLLEKSLKTCHVPGTVQVVKDDDMTVFEVRVKAKNFPTLANLEAPIWLAMHSLVESMAVIHKRRFSLVFVDPPGVQWSQGVVVNLRPSSISKVAPPEQCHVGI